MIERLHLRFRAARAGVAWLVVIAAARAVPAGEPVHLATLASSQEQSYLCPSSGPVVAGTDHVYFVAATDLLAADMRSRTVAVLRDVRTGGSHGAIHTLMATGDRLFFRASDGRVEDQLWTSDGTVAGTRLVLDKRFGTFAARATYVTAHQGHVYFNQTDPATGFQMLYQSDGTDAGTRVLGSISDPGPMYSLPFALFGAGRTPAYGLTTLWKSDGTAPGTSVLASFSYNSALLSVGTLGDAAIAWIYTSAGDSSSYALWRSDLTPAGTVRLATVGGPLSSYNSIYNSLEREMVASHGLLYVVTSGPGEYRQLWRTDGTAAGTFAVAPPGVEGFGPYKPAFLADAGGVVLFAGDDPEHGTELWASDGTSAGTVLVADINPGPASSVPEWLTSSGGVVYFVAGDVFSGRELWRSDGTAAGTRQVADLCPGPFDAFRPYHFAEGQSEFRPMVAFDSEVAFLASSGAGGCRLWTSNGTEAGTAPVGGELPPASGWEHSELGPTAGHLAVNGSVVVGPSASRRDQGPWRTDGAPGSFESLVPLQLLAPLATPWPRLHGQMLVEGPRGVLRFDGTVGGTAEAFQTRMQNPSNAEGGAFYFWVNGQVLWRSDGTPTGTRPVRSFAYPSSSSSVSEIVASGARAHFYASDGVNGVEPWRSDGSAAGTIQVADLCPGSCGAMLRGVKAIAGFAYYREFSGTCWVTDGTAAGTREVEHDACGTNVLHLEDTILVGIRPSGGGVVLYRARPDFTDLQEIRYFEDLSLAVTAADGAPPTLPLLFRGRSLEHGEELWRTDGTRDGTFIVADLNPGPLSSSPRFLTQVFGRTYFTASDPEHGAEVWSSDGTAAGTVLELDVVPGAASAVPRGYTRAGNRLIFELRRPDDAQEFWSFRASPLPRLDAANAVAGEGRLGDGFARVLVTLTEPAPTNVSVAYGTEDGTAKCGADYLPVSGRVTIPAGSLGPVTILVPLVDDAASEPTEELFIRLSDPTGAVLGHASATVTVADDGYGRPNPRRRILRPAVP